MRGGYAITVGGMLSPTLDAHAGESTITSCRSNLTSQAPSARVAWIPGPDQDTQEGEDAPGTDRSGVVFLGQDTLSSL